MLDAEPAPETEAGAKFWLDAEPWDEAAIPRRPWIVPRYLLRGSISLLIGAPGAAKSLLALTWGIALALGESHEDFAPIAKSRVVICNAEDDLDEQRRRISAALRQFGAAPADLGDRLMRLGPVRVATLMRRSVTGGFEKAEAFAELSRTVAERGVDVLVLDPLVEMHELDENSNGELRKFIAAIRAFAIEAEIAVVLVHHVRKGAVIPGDMDAARGASALIGAVRAAWTLAAMSESDAETFNIPKDRRSYFARLDDAKANYGPASAPRWFEKMVIQIANGEALPALVPWSPPVPRAASAENCRAMLREIERGVGGEPFSPKLGPHPRSIRALLRRHGFAGAAERPALDALLEAGAEIAVFRTGGRKTAQGLRHNGAPLAEWMDLRHSHILLVPIARV